MISDPYHSGCYQPRAEIKKDHAFHNIDGDSVIVVSSSFNELSDFEKHKFIELSHHFTSGRHNTLWSEKADPKLKMLVYSTKMLICADDLGSLIPSISKKLDEYGMLGLHVQRISRNNRNDFDDFHDFRYLSICCPSPHNFLTLRGWWKLRKNESIKFWYQILKGEDEFNPVLQPGVQEKIIKQNLNSHSMWTIFLLQDLAGITKSLQSLQTPEDEQINDISNNETRKIYRYPCTLR